MEEALFAFVGQWGAGVRRSARKRPSQPAPCSPSWHYTLHPGTTLPPPRPSTLPAMRPAGRMGEGVLWGYHRPFGIAGTQARPFGIRSVEDEYAGREWRGLRFVVVFEPSFDESDLVSFHAVVMKIAGVSAAGDKDDNDGFLIGS